MKKFVKCPLCGEQAATGQKIVNIPLSDGSGIDLRVTVSCCGNCDEYLEAETEIA